MAKKTDPTIKMTSNQELDEVAIPGVLFIERMGDNHYYAIINGEAFDIKRNRQYRRWRIESQITKNR